MFFVVWLTCYKPVWTLAPRCYSSVSCLFFVVLLTFYKPVRTLSPRCYSSVSCLFFVVLLTCYKPVRTLAPRCYSSVSCLFFVVLLTCYKPVRTLATRCYSSVSCLFFVVFVLMAQFVLVNVVVAVLMKHLEVRFTTVLVGFRRDVIPAVTQAVVAGVLLLFLFSSGGQGR